MKHQLQAGTSSAWLLPGPFLPACLPYQQGLPAPTLPHCLTLPAAASCCSGSCGQRCLLRSARRCWLAWQRQRAGRSCRPSRRGWHSWPPSCANWCDVAQLAERQPSSCSPRSRLLYSFQVVHTHFLSPDFSQAWWGGEGLCKKNRNRFWGSSSERGGKQTAKQREIEWKQCYGIQTSFMCVLGNMRCCHGGGSAAAGSGRESAMCESRHVLRQSPAPGFCAAPAAATAC